MDRLQKPQSFKLNNHGPSLPTKQSGYVIIVAVVLLGAMLLATLQYFEQSTTNLQSAGYSRDSAESLMLAQSAANALRGHLLFNKDLDNDDIIDRNEIVDETNLDNLPLFYMYYVSDNSTSFANTEPSILQLIANGEARSSDHTPVGLTKSRIPTTTTRLMINDLYSDGGNIKPIIYVLDNENKLIIDPDDETWKTKINNGDTAAAAWLELTRLSDEDGSIEINVQAVAQIGASKSYVQRIVGIFSNKLGLIGATNESSTP